MSRAGTQLLRPAALLAVLALAGACSSLPGHADEPAPIVRGPIPTRSLEPVKATYLQFRPRRAATLPSGDTQLSVLSAYASIYENGSSGGDSVDFDGEIWRTSLDVRRGVGPRADVEVELPVVYATGGFLDPIIQGFHDFFGFPNGGREDAENDAYDMIATHDGTVAYHMEGNEIGIGDIPVVLTVAVLEESESQPALAVRGGVELPTGSDDDGFGNGKVDAGLGLLTEKSFGRWTATGAVDWVDAKSSDSFEDAGVAAKDDLDVQVGVEYRWNDDLSLLAGSVFTGPATDDIGLEEINGSMLSLDLGVSWDVGTASRLLCVFSEDLITQSAPDFTVMAGWTLSL